MARVLYVLLGVVVLAVGLGVELCLPVCADQARTRQCETLPVCLMEGLAWCGHQGLWFLPGLLAFRPNDDHVDRGWTLLHYAADMSSAARTWLLLTLGANPNAQIIHDQVPLHYARHRPYTVQVLLARGADPNIPNRFGDAPLHDASRYPGVATVLPAWDADPKCGTTRAGRPCMGQLCAATWKPSPYYWPMAQIPMCATVQGKPPCTMPSGTPACCISCWHRERILPSVTRKGGRLWISSG